MLDIKNIIWEVVIKVTLSEFVKHMPWLYRKLTSCLFSKGKLGHVWQGVNGAYIEYQEGDLFKIAAQDSDELKLIVIPVNTAFDVIVEDPSPDNPHPLVSKNTLHGKWLQKAGEYGLTLPDIESQIQKSLKEEKVTGTVERKDGPRKEYPIGTIAAVQGPGNTLFLLAALSRFDKNNNAHATRDDLVRVVKRIVDYANHQGQQSHVYLPVMGTGSSRTGMGPDKAFRCIVGTLKSCTKDILGPFTVVIYPADSMQILKKGDLR